jgi:hypothetical protein
VIKRTRQSRRLALQELCGELGSGNIQLLQVAERIHHRWHVRITQHRQITHIQF